MAEIRELKSRGVSFNGKCENKCLSKASNKHSSMENKQPFSSIYDQPSDISRSPNHAMEFLCRSWSSSASDFQQLFSSTNLLLPLHHANERIEEHEERKVEVEETSENSQAMSSRYTTNKVDKTWMDFSHMKGWLKGKPFTNFLRSHREKKRAEARLHTAQLHASLSLTQLAAAIAGFATANGNTESAQDHHHIKRMSPPSSNGEGIAPYQDMGVVVASAAALLTTVCAEAAESLGAKRARVASAVKSGLATQTPIDMITLTATAATCLRGAATLESRTKADTYFPSNQELLKVGVQTLLIMPSGEKELKWVSIQLKQSQPTLSFRKKYLGGALTASKQYKIMNVIEQIKDSKGSYFLSLKTNKGIIKLLFDDEKQSIIFVSTISNLLQMHKSSS